MKKAFYIALVIAVLISLSIGLAMGYVALQHNPQNMYCMAETHEDCTVDWLSLLGIIFSWFVVILLKLLAVIFPVWALCWLVTKKLKNRNKA